MASAVETKLADVSTAIEEAGAKLAQLGGDLAAHGASREAAKQALAEGDAVRSKEAEIFAHFKEDSETNVAAIDKAVVALEKGATGSFLQSASATIVRNLALSKLNTDSDRDQLMSFLSASQGSQYNPVGGDVTGILKQMGDELRADLASATKEEEARIAAHSGLVSAKKKEIAANGAAIEDKSVREGELKVRITEMKNDVSDTASALEADKKFLADLETKCSTAESDYDKACKARSDELLALAETIKILNSDDALELFKKALPAPTSFLQAQMSSARTKAKALNLLKGVKNHGHNVEMDFISLALQGKQTSFDKVIQMIDDMVGVLKREQADDVDKKEYCGSKADKLDDDKKEAERAITNSEAGLSEAQDLLKTVAEEIDALSAGIHALDKSVAEAGVQRKEEHAAYVNLIAQDTAARKLLGMAKNRMNKFYNPALHVAEAALASVEVKLHQHTAPPPAPELPGAHEKKAEESNGVIVLLDALVADLDKEMQIAETEEKNAQADYDKTISDAATKRADDVQTLSDKKGTEADTGAAVQEHTDDLKSRKAELAATLKVIQGLHGECDWLVKYFDVRKEARTEEIESLKNAKAVLSGADYALVQTSRHSEP